MGTKAGSNWAGNVRWQPVEVARPTSEDDVRSVLTRAATQGWTVRPVGSGHSFTPLAATDGISLDLGALSGVRHVDGGIVTFGAGTPLHMVNALLDGMGRALPNLGDIDRQTLAGAISTGTHGTGARFTGLAAQVAAFRMVTVGGDVLDCTTDSHPELFAAAMVGLGAFGVVTEIALRTVPAFGLDQIVWPDRVEDVMEHLGEHLLADHFEFHWFPLASAVQAKSARRMGPDEDLAPMSAPRAFLESVVVENVALGALCEVARRAPGQLPRLHGLAGRLISRRELRDRSFRVFASTRSVRFVESEFAIPAAALPDVLDAVATLARDLPVGPAFPVEVRFAEADEVWLSTAFERRNAYVAIHQYRGMPYEAYFEGFARICAAVAGRPHWGKVHPLAFADLASLYPRFERAAALRAELDPSGVLLNEHLRRLFLAP